MNIDVLTLIVDEMAWRAFCHVSNAVRASNLGAPAAGQQCFKQAYTPSPLRGSCERAHAWLGPCGGGYGV